MSEEDADQGSGRETKYSIDSAQGELQPSTTPAPPLLDGAIARS